MTISHTARSLAEADAILEAERAAREPSPDRAALYVEVITLREQVAFLAKRLEYSQRAVDAYYRKAVEREARIRELELEIKLAAVELDARREN